MTIGLSERVENFRALLEGDQFVAGVGDIGRDRYLEITKPISLANIEQTIDIAQYEMAFRMQASVPELTDLAAEPQHVLDLYGPQVTKPGTFAYNCLLARRLAAGHPPPGGADAVGELLLADQPEGALQAAGDPREDPVEPLDRGPHQLANHVPDIAAAEIVAGVAHTDPGQVLHVVADESARGCNRAEHPVQAVRSIAMPQWCGLLGWSSHSEGSSWW